MVGVGKILGLLLMLALFVGVTGLVILMNGLWGERVIAPLQNGHGITGQISFFFAELVMVVFCSMILVGGVVTMIQAFVGGLYVGNVPGGGAAAGSKQFGFAMSLPIGLFFIVITSAILFMFVDWVVYNVPLIFYIGALMVFGTRIMVSEVSALMG